MGVLPMRGLPMGGHDGSLRSMSYFLSVFLRCQMDGTRIVVDSGQRVRTVNIY